MDKILYPFEWLISWILYGVHNILTIFGFSEGSGPAWVASIVIMTVIVRLCILPLFIKQVHSSRGMQAIQPQIKAIQKKYKGKTDQASKEAMSKETMALYQKHGVNPMGSCLPIVIQMPFFFSLFRVLSYVGEIAQGVRDPIGPFTQIVAEEIQGSVFFGAKLSDTFQTIDSSQGGRIAIIILIALMCATMFINQLQVTRKNTPRATMDSPMFKTQKMMVVLFPIMYIFSGAIFPVGVLIYWLTTNLWTLGQSLWQMEFMPTPGSVAAEVKEAKVARKEAEDKTKRIEAGLEEDDSEIVDERKQQRVQPKSKKKSKKK